MKRGFRAADCVGVERLSHFLLKQRYLDQVTFRQDPDLLKLSFSTSNLNVFKVRKGFFRCLCNHSDEFHASAPLLSSYGS